MKPILRSELAPAVAAALELTEDALNESHCPHSGLCVAAGLVIGAGKVVTGVNYESDSYGLTLCAERAAIVRAQSGGVIAQASSIVLVARWKKGSSQATPLTPCGACRQWLAELSRRLGRDLPVYSFWDKGPEGIQTSAMNLLPGAFAFENH
jgi:cytidine deaminase